MDKPSNHFINPNFRGARISKKKSIAVNVLIEKIIAGNKTALSQAITLIESTALKHYPIAQQLIEGCLPYANNSIRIGITGVPGVGKSTCIEALGMQLINQGKKVAVLAVDPSSSISHGSILGDKTRMEQLSLHDHAFIRPSASGDSLGGVARKTREAILLCEAAGYNYIIVETVGVGQSETAVHSMVDFFLLLKLAGAGDELQGIKRGIIEMADAIVINKADGKNQTAAKIAQTAFTKALHLYPPKENGWLPKVYTASALHNEGILEIWELITAYISSCKQNKSFHIKRTQQSKYWLLQTIEQQLKDSFYNNPEVKKVLPQLLQTIENNKVSPFAAADQLLKLI